MDDWTARWTTGRQGGGLDFAGDVSSNNQHVNIGDVPELSNVSAFTIAFWFKRDTDRTGDGNSTNHDIDNVMIAKSAASTNDNIEIGSTGNSLEIYLDTAQLDPISTPYIVPDVVYDGIWTHLALTYDSSRTNEVKIFVNGVLTVSEPQWGGNLDQSDGSPLTLGLARPTLADPWGDFDGVLDEFAVFSRSLTDMEVATIYFGLGNGIGDLCDGEVTWNGSAGSSWGNSANWSPPVVPGSGDTVIFPDDATFFTVTLEGDRIVNLVQFLGGTNGYFLEGSTLSLESGNLDALGGTATHTINSNIELLSSGVWKQFGDSVVHIRGAISESGGSYGFDKRETGTLILADAPSTFTGDVVVTHGTMSSSTFFNATLAHNSLDLKAGTILGGGPNWTVWSLSGAGDVAPDCCGFIHIIGDESTIFTGKFIASGFEHRGSGTFTLTGDSSLNRFPGRVSKGVVNLRGRVDQMDFTTFGTGTLNMFVGQVGRLIYSARAVINLGDPFLSLTSESVIFSSNNGTMNFDIGGFNAGVDHDFLSTDSPTFGGTLNISYADAFTATEGDVFRIMEWTGDIQQEFASANFPDKQPWVLFYDYAAGELLAKICPSGGEDCNNNGADDNCEADNDGDGFIDACDICLGFDDNGPDVDGDGVPDPCDQCDGDDSVGDSDNDGVCDDIDICPGEDDNGPDLDEDGIPDLCDLCDGEATGDLDGDEDIDLIDYQAFADCMTGPMDVVDVDCNCFDLDADTFITLRDFYQLQQLFSGSSIAELPGEIRLENLAANISRWGFAIFGEAADDFAGYSVGIMGDINGDGLSEILVGAPSAGRGLDSQRGRSYVIYGKLDNNNINLVDVAAGVGGFAMDGEHGAMNGVFFRREIGEVFADVAGPEGEGSGFVVASAGDVNGDGVDDMLITAPYAPVDGERWGGRAYVLFGDSSLQAFSPFNLAALATEGSGLGYIINGSRGICPDCQGGIFDQNGDLTGWSARGARDFNGDGLADIFMGAPNFGDGDEGIAYAVFGKADDVPVNVNDFLNGITDQGVSAMFPETINESSYGNRILSAGDYTGDGLSDLLMFPRFFIANLNFLIHGRESSLNIELGFDSTDDFTALTGGDLSCNLVNGELLCVGRFLNPQPVASDGDFNGDGRPDWIMSALNGDGPSAVQEFYILFGTDELPTDMDLRFGPHDNQFDIPIDGVRIVSNNAIFGNFGRHNEISMVGDINGDGLDDVVIGMGESTGLLSHRTFVIFGRAESATLNLEDLIDGQGGIVIYGGEDAARAGWAVNSAGDINGDGFDDLIIGAPFDNTKGTKAGAAYLIYGDDFNGSITHRGYELNDILNGTMGADTMVAGRGNDILNGRGGFDSMYGGAGDDTITIGDAHFRRIRGGTGFDTLKVSAEFDLNMADFLGRVDDIERIDLSDPGSSTLFLRQLELYNLSRTHNQLFVLGTGDDLVQAKGDDWIFDGVVNVDGLDFQSFTDDLAKLFVQVDVGVNFSPTIITRLMEILENSPIDTSLGFVEAQDPDGGAVVNFAIVGGNVGTAFAIDAVTGEVFVNGVINFETLSVYTLIIEIEDNEGDLSARDVTIDVICLNEPPIWSVQEFITPISEHTYAGVAIGSFTATDPDSEDVVMYLIDLTDPSLTSPALPGAFEIDPLTGDLTVGNSALLDWETSKVQELIVYAEDTQGLRSPPSLVSITLEDVLFWTIRFESSFETSNASMWSTDGTVGPSTLTFADRIDGDDASGISKNLLGISINLDVSGFIDYEVTIATDSGSVEATIPFKAEMVFDDEIILGQPFSFDLSVLTPDTDPTMSGMTPAADVDLFLKLTRFKVLTSFGDFGPYTGDNTGNERLQSSVSRPWAAIVQPDGSLATDGTLSSTLLSMKDIQWDQYLFLFLGYAGIPSNTGRIQELVIGTVRFNVSYILWTIEMAGALRVDQNLGLTVNGYTARITFENGDSNLVTIDGTTDLTLPAGADPNGDGFVDFEVRFAIDSTFSNRSDYVGVITPSYTMGYLNVHAEAIFETAKSRKTIGPVVDVELEIDIGADDGGVPTPWPSGDTEMFPLGGFNTVVMRGSIDLMN